MIEINNVNFTYSSGVKNTGLKNINLNIKKGEVILLCGGSGCGKTTLTRLINGLIPHYYEGNLSGTIKVNGKSVADCQLYELANSIGSVFQNPRSQFFNVDTTSELAFGCENLGVSEDQVISRIKNVTSQLSLYSLLNRSIFELSGGEKQKIACGSVSALLPDIFVLDEPTSNLDLEAINDLKDIISIWKQQGKTVIIAEHRLYFLRDLADRVLYMENGRIVKEYTNSQFFKNLSDNERINMGLRTLIPPYLPKRYESIINREDIISFSDFSFSYGKYKALSLENLNVPMGSAIAVIGHNGAGKTTFYRCLCGLEKKCKGLVSIKGKALKCKHRLSNSFMVMQDVNHQLFTESVIDEVLLSMKEENNEMAEKILEKLDLLTFKDVHPMSLSGGQKQRVAIACAIASERDIIIFDEPTSGLDLLHMKEVAQNIKYLINKGKTVFIVTHDPEFINLCCTHIIHLKNGQVCDYYALAENKEYALSS